MSRALIGRTVRRLRQEKGLAQQALAARLGISASYLNLIEHDQRKVSGTLLIKLAETFHVDLAALSGVQERRLEGALRARIPVQSRYRQGDASCCLMRRRGISSTAAPIISPSSRKRPKPSSRL